MNIKYYSYCSGGICTAVVPEDLKQELLEKWNNNQKKLKKMGIKSFEEYVITVYSMNY